VRFQSAQLGLIDHLLEFGAARGFFPRRNHKGRAPVRAGPFVLILFNHEGYQGIFHPMNTGRISKATGTTAAALSNSFIACSDK
jgi:hypothetical protein